MSKPTVSAAGVAMSAQGQPNIAEAFDDTRRLIIAASNLAAALDDTQAQGLHAVICAAEDKFMVALNWFEAGHEQRVHKTADAALLAMQSAIDAADRELEAALAALKAADKAYFAKAPDRPEQPETVFSAEEQWALDAFAAKLRAGREMGRPPEWVAYDQAVQDHEREVERLKAECGVTAAHEMEAAVHEATGRAAQALIDTPAKTLAGLIFKARYAEAHDYDEDVMVSIVDDLLALADNPEDLADV